VLFKKSTDPMKLTKINRQFLTIIWSGSGTGSIFA